jgi:hypothetical protein
MAGRKKKYHTEEDLKEANRIKQRRYYERNADKVRKRNIERYHDNKQKGD